MPEKRPRPPDPRPKTETKTGTQRDELIIMLAGLGFIIASSGIVPYLMALFKL